MCGIVDSPLRLCSSSFVKARLSCRRRARDIQRGKQKELTLEDWRWYRCGHQIPDLDIVTCVPFVIFMLYSALSMNPRFTPATLEQPIDAQATPPSFCAVLGRRNSIVTRRHAWESLGIAASQRKIPYFPDSAVACGCVSANLTGPAEL